MLAHILLASQPVPADVSTSLSRRSVRAPPAGAWSLPHTRAPPVCQDVPKSEIACIQANSFLVHGSTTEVVAMKNVILAVLVLFVCLASVGCYSTPIMPPQGSIFTSVGAPLSPDAGQMAPASKSGEATSFCILGLVAVGDCSITNAAQDGNIKKPVYAEYDCLNALFVFQQFTIKVYGD